MHIDPRPVLIGMNNPHSANPSSALLPFPRGSAGHRLWQILNGYRPIPRIEYLNRFDRRNVVDDEVWDRAAALAAGDRLRRELNGRRVLVLGREAMRALRLQTDSAQFCWCHSHASDFHWAWAPHPSGLSRAYNSGETRLRLATLLSEMIDRSVDSEAPMVGACPSSTPPARLASGAL